MRLIHSLARPTTSLSPPNFAARSGAKNFQSKKFRTKFRLRHESITTRLAKRLWGAIFKIEFTDLKSRAPKKHKIPPLYFVVIDDRIVLLNEEDNDAAVKKISAMNKPPEFELDNIYGITSGKFTREDGPWKTTIEIKGDACTYLASHNSGHFTKIVWKKGVGLVEYASGYGADADGYRLKRIAKR